MRPAIDLHFHIFSFGPIEFILALSKHKFVVAEFFCAVFTSKKASRYILTLESNLSAIRTEPTSQLDFSFSFRGSEGGIFN